MHRLIINVTFPILIVTAIGCGSIKQSYLESFVADEKGNLPKMLFSGLEAVDVESGPGELIYICNAKGIDDDAAKLGKTRTRMALEKFVKGNQAKLKQLSDNKLKLTIALQGSDGTELYRLSVNPWEL